jgi:hypothetical protein
MYWIVVICGFITLRFKETRGHWPGLKAKAQAADPEHQRSPSLPESTDSVLAKEVRTKDVDVREVS